jgi:hypothetical protein
MPIMDAMESSRSGSVATGPSATMLVTFDLRAAVNGPSRFN